MDQISAFELPKTCKYWRWPMVQKFLIERSMSVHHFDGCMSRVIGNNNNQPMKKSWTIAGIFEQLSKLDSLRCDCLHEHDQSGGKALKFAENYTFRLTDMLHECFRSCGGPSCQKESQNRLFCQNGRHAHHS